MLTLPPFQKRLSVIIRAAKKVLQLMIKWRTSRSPHLSFIPVEFKFTIVKWLLWQGLLPPCTHFLFSPYVVLVFLVWSMFRKGSIPTSWKRQVWPREREILGWTMFSGSSCIASNNQAAVISLICWWLTVHMIDREFNMFMNAIT